MRLVRRAGGLTPEVASLASRHADRGSRSAASSTVALPSVPLPLPALPSAAPLAPLDLAAPLAGWTRRPFPVFAPDDAEVLVAAMCVVSLSPATQSRPSRGAPVRRLGRPRHPE